MWQLTCDTDLFDGKVIWLRPGSRHLLGRTSSRTEAGERVRYIDHKNVSRKHLLLQVSQTRPEDSGQIHVRSTVSASDNSKTGTHINGTKVVKQQVELDRTENKLQLGTSEYVFHIKWVPVVLTCTNIAKSLKASADPLANYRCQLQQTDIKLLATYVSNVTTHVVASKRNNPSNLQALAQGKWTVSYAWLDKLSQALQALPADDNGDEGPGLSPLERNLSEAWPIESDFLVDPGSEPVKREKDLLQPNPQRAEIFSGLTFVFLLDSQYETLMPVITACGGKACKRVTSMDDSVSEIITFLRQLAEDKSTVRRSTSSTMDKIVVVRPTGKKEHDLHWSELDGQLASALGRPTVVQNEFLDIILTLDKTKLHLPTPGTNNMEISQAHSIEEDETVVEQHTEPHAVDNTQARSRQPIKKSRFKGFQDFDPSQIIRPVSPPPESIANEPMHSDIRANASHGPHGRSLSQKRKADLSEISEIEEALHDHLPGMAALKKRRIANDADFMAHQADHESDNAKAGGKEGRLKPEFNVQEIKGKLQAQLQKAEKEQAEEEEQLKAQLRDLDLERYTDCAQVEEYEVDLHGRDKPGAVAHGHAGAGWNPAWNGRRNFKAFRPQGQSGDRTRRPRVFVQLVEASKEACDADDTSWADDLDPTMADQVHSFSPPITASHAMSQSRQSHLHDTIDFASGLSNGHTDQSAATETPRSSGMKRPAQQQTGGTIKKKRQNVASRLAAISDDDEDDSDDGLKFRRKRR